MFESIELPNLFFSPQRKEVGSREGHEGNIKAHHQRWCALKGPNLILETADDTRVSGNGKISWTEARLPKSEIKAERWPDVS